MEDSCMGGDHKVGESDACAYCQLYRNLGEAHPSDCTCTACKPPEKARQLWCGASNREIAARLRETAQYAMPPQFKEALRKELLKLFQENRHVSPRIRSSASARSDQ